MLATRNDDLLTSPDGHRRQAKVLATIAGVGEDGPPVAGGSGARSARVRTASGTTTGPPSPSTPAGLPDGWGHWLLVRRQIQPAEGKTMRELAFYRCAGPATTPLRELIRVAGARWAIEECFQTAKNEAGLDHYQVRTWRAWYAHITLAMLAAAYLAATRAARTPQRPTNRPAKRGNWSPAPNS